MMTPVCIKLHNFKKFKIEHEGQLYELAATSSENLLSEFQKYKPDVRQLLVARPIVAEDFESLAEGSVVFASTQSYITEAQMQAGENVNVHEQSPHEFAATRGYKSPTTAQSTAIVNYNTSPTMVQTHCSSERMKRHPDMAMLENFCPPPSGFIEAAVDSGPIDTLEVACRVRDILEKHKISQSLFSKYVIRRSQGTTSDLLRTPKMWDRMSEEGRTPYRRMKAWLEGDLAYNIQMLIKLKQGHEIVPNSYFTPKGLRTKFSEEQRDALEAFFSSDPRLTHDTLETFASNHNLTVSAVRNWVNNRKQRLKRNLSGDGNDTKFLKTEHEDLNEDSVERRGDDPPKEDAGLRESDGENSVTSPCGVPTMVNGSTIRNEVEGSETMTKSEQGNGTSMSGFRGSSEIPTMVENLAMDCMGIPAE